MIDLPSPREVTSDFDHERDAWLDECADRDVAVLGGGMAAVTAGLILQEQGFSVVIVETGRSSRDRFFTEEGPAMILSPVDEILEELGCSAGENPPLWMTPLSVECTLLHGFFEAGGQLVRRAVIDGDPRAENGAFHIRVNLGSNRRLFESDELIVTAPLLEPEPPSARPDDLLHRMVLATQRRTDGMLQAGFQALGHHQIPAGIPVENGLVLSGRKVAEILLQP